MSVCNCPFVCLCVASDVVLGDGLVLLSAVLYAVSNVCQEYTVKNLSRVDFLGMMGLFGTVISGIQLWVMLYTTAIKYLTWDLYVELQEGLGTKLGTYKGTKGITSEQLSTDSH